MKYCSKCGKQLMDEAVICPACGCPTDDYKAKQAGSSTYSSDYPKVKEFASKAKSVKRLGIVALILCLGIGIFFSIAVWCMAGGIQPNKMPIPNVKLTDPREIAEFEEAKRNMRLGKKLAFVPYCVVIICLAIILFVLMMSSF